MKQSRSGSASLGEADLDTLRYDFRTLSIFSPTPLLIEVPDLPNLQVGHGLGGFHWSLFVRGESCTGCGRCCQKSWRRTWWWHETNPRPSGLRSIEVRVNGVKHRLYYHMQTSGQVGGPCDYLDPLIIDGVHKTEGHGIEMHVCSLHGDTVPYVFGTVEELGGTAMNFDVKPVHCRMDPFTAPREVKRDGQPIFILSRRLPGRNWQWPKCPIDVYSLPNTPKIMRQDYQNLKSYAEAYRSVPGVMIDRGIEVFVSKLYDLQTQSWEAETVWLDYEFRL